MQEKLVIYLNAEALLSPSWAVLTAQGVVRQSAHYDSVSGLAAIAAEKEVIVIVPGEDVLLTTLPLPKMNRSRLLQAVPFALEEELVAEVDTLHFAIGDDQSNGELPVAIVAHEKMQQWMEVLHSSELRPQAMLPTTFALPYQSDTWYVAINDMATVRTGLFTGFTCDKNNLTDLLSFALTSSPQPPHRIQIQNYTTQAFKPNLMMPVPVEEVLLPTKEWINELAHETGKLPYSLLQGKYAAKKSQLPQIDKIWKGMIALAMVWLGLLFLYPVISYVFLKYRMTAIQSQIAEIYKRHFPQASAIVAPKLRMEEKLKAVDEQSGENRFLLSLSYVGKGLAEIEGIKLNRIDVQNDQLSLDLTAKTPENFSAFVDFLTKQGLSVKQQNATLTDSHINALLIIEI